MVLFIALHSALLGPYRTVPPKKAQYSLFALYQGGIEGRAALKKASRYTQVSQFLSHPLPFSVTLSVPPDNRS